MTCRECGYDAVEFQLEKSLANLLSEDWTDTVKASAFQYVHPRPCLSPNSAPAVPALSLVSWMATGPATSCSILISRSISPME